LWSRDIEGEVLSTARELGIGIVPYSPLGRGFLTGEIRSLDQLDENDFRRHVQPRFQGDNLARNLELVEQVKAMAEAKGVTAGQLALAWVHAQGDDVFPIPGTKRVKWLEQNVAAFDVQLDPDERSRLESVLEGVSGARYPDMSWVGVETK
jgi:aryl-alcohol dehydrogenase-like predicted oxidoreductase